MKFVSFDVGYTGVGDRNITEFIGDSDGHFQGSLDCAEESSELSTVRALAERVLPRDEHFRNSGANGSGLKRVDLDNHEGSGR